MNKEMETKLNELLQSEDFLEKLNECNDTEEIKALLAVNDVDMSADEIETAIKEGRVVLVNEGYITDNDELTEKGLEIVPGGLGVKSLPLIFYVNNRLPQQAKAAVLLGINIALFFFKKK